MNIPPLVLIDAPSNLGLKPTGVEQLAEALRAAKLPLCLSATDGGNVAAPAFNATRDPQTKLLNGEAIAGYSRQLADAVALQLNVDCFPIVLGGDCSILLGPMLALRRRGRFGLAHVDGHADFYLPEQDSNGEVASMDLALACGYGPDLLTNIDGLYPYVRDLDTIQIGSRDAEQAAEEGSQDIRAVSAVEVWDLARIRAAGAEMAVAHAVGRLRNPELDGFWIHFDADVLDDTIMPAVDYRIPDGLQLEEAVTIMRVLLSTGKAVGMTVTIYNPKLDRGGAAGQILVEVLEASFSSG